MCSIQSCDVAKGQTPGEAGEIAAREEGVSFGQPTKITPGQAGESAATKEGVTFK
jgi:hypothetical protein